MSFIVDYPISKGVLQDCGYYWTVIGMKWCKELGTHQFTYDGTCFTIWDSEFKPLSAGQCPKTMNQLLQFEKDYYEEFIA